MAVENKNFDWIPIYEELANKLYDAGENYNKTINDLMNLLVKNDCMIPPKIKEAVQNNSFKTLDPFSVFALFNRGIKDENRINTIKHFKSFFKLVEKIPSSFNGIPIINNNIEWFSSYFEISTPENRYLSELFQKAITNQIEESFLKTFDLCLGINKIKLAYVTMMLFWIRPNKFLAMDSKNKNYLNVVYDIVIPKNCNSAQYLQILLDVKSKIENNIIKEKTFSEFSHNAHIFSKIVLKEEKELFKARKLSSQKRQQLLENANPKPTVTTVQQTVFKRNVYVIAEVLERANGICERCKQPAPFLKDNSNEPYLEVHHKIPLSEGGDDTVANAIALCPNCHRWAHNGNKTTYNAGFENVGKN